MKIVISASRRTDLPSFFPEWLAGALARREARVLGPGGRVSSVDLAPESVHSLVIWSKNFSNLIRDRSGLQKRLAAYDQCTFHFTITGLGGTEIEPGAPDFKDALSQLKPLAALSGDPRRVCLRFDPVVFWSDGNRVESNAKFFPEAAEAAAEAGIRDVRISFAQWYRKAKSRALRRGFPFIDPSEPEKKDVAAWLAGEASERGLRIFACSQSFVSAVQGIEPSSCIDGRRLRDLHPRKEPASLRRDRSQRKECLCTESKDIGSYSQPCHHGCVYCYANPASG